MATDCIPHLTLTFPQKMKPVVARFDTEYASTEGGGIRLNALDERLTRTEDVAACLPDRRDPRKVQHALRDLLRSGCSAWPVGTRTAMMPPDWRTIRCTSWRWAGIRSPGRPWPRHPRWLGLRMRQPHGPGIGGAGHWPRR